MLIHVKFFFHGCNIPMPPGVTPKSIAMKIFISVLFSFLLLQGFSQTPALVLNDPNVRERTVNGPFHAVSVSQGIELYLVKGSAEQVAVSVSDPTIEENLITEVENGELKVYFRNKEKMLKNLGKKHKAIMKVYVSCTRIERLKATSGSHVRMPETLVVGNLSATVNSGAMIHGSIQATALDVDQSSGAIVSLDGRASSLNLNLSSGAIFKGIDLVTDQCTAKASSGASIRVTVNNDLSAHANSGGSIHYKGNGSIKDIKVNSGGVVKKI